MPPKNKGKKGKKGNNDDGFWYVFRLQFSYFLHVCIPCFRDEAGESIATNGAPLADAGDASVGNGRPDGETRTGISSFASLQVEDGGADDDDDDFGGLMVR